MSSLDLCFIEVLSLVLMMAAHAFGILDVFLS